MRGDICISDYGAVADGKTLNTNAIQAAISVAAERGGRVVVPPGVFMTGGITLRSNVALHLERGAVLFGSPNLQDYTPRRWGHHKDITPWHLVYAELAENVAITGEGAIDGNGPAFWEPERRHEWDFWRERPHRVSPMVELTRCKHVRVEGVTLRHSAGWTLHLHDCDDSSVRGVTIRNTYFGPNADGIDATGCHRLIISDCNIETGDDAIALKTTRLSRSCEWVTITNCVLQTSCVGIRIGFESHKAHRHITVSNCAIPRCSRVVDIRSLEGGDIEHVLMSNIVATTNSGWPVNRPIEISLHRCENMWDESRPDGHEMRGVFDAVPAHGAIRHVTLRDFDITTDARSTIVADEGAVMEDIVLDGIRFQYVLLEAPYGGGGHASYLPGDHEDARLASAAIVAKNVGNLQVRNVSVRWPTYPVPDWWHLLSSPQRMIHASFYGGSEEEIRAGRRTAVYKVLWGKRLRKAKLDLSGMSASDGSDPLDMKDSDG